MIQDRERFLALVSGDLALAGEVLRASLEGLPTYLDHARTAVLRDDPTATAEAAHRIVGSLVVICAVAASASAGRLERAARSGAMDEARAEFRELEVRIAELEADCASSMGAIGSGPNGG